MSFAQTCCSGGVPLSANIGFQSIGEGSWQWALSFDYNKLRTLYFEDEVLALNNRERITRSYLGRLGYGISDRVSIEAFMPFINQKRNITQNNGEINSESSKGLGDILLLLQYDFARSVSNTITIGIGIKLPTGSTGKTNSRGLLLVNDMQPGSGAIDIVGRISWIHNFVNRPSMSVYINSVISEKGTDSEYLGSQPYQYGRDFQLMAGLSDQVVVGSFTFYPGISLRYRTVKQDLINRNPLENTGGHWIFARASIGVNLYRNHRLSLNYESPVYTRVDGTQLSPDYIFNITYSASFSPNPKSELLLKEIP